MDFPRTSGLLLHPTSLPGRFGIGDLGDTAYRWVDFLAATGQTLWQVLPLAQLRALRTAIPVPEPVALPGNPLLISPERLAARKLLEASALEQVPAFPLERVDYGPVSAWKMALLHRSFERFRESSGARAGGVPGLHGGACRVARRFRAFHGSRRPTTASRGTPGSPPSATASPQR